MKKPIKTSKTPAPAKKAAKSSQKKTAAPVVKKAAPKQVLTSIVAQIDVGFGNALYIRGEGPGLSWEQGRLMTCIADDQWTISLPDAGKSVVCKFLLNDLIWSTGGDFVLTPAGNTVLSPMF